MRSSVRGWNWRSSRRKRSTCWPIPAELSRAASISNPIDLLGDALSDRYEFALRAVLDDANVDAVLVLLSPHAMTECAGTAEAIVRVSKENGKKPILASFLRGQPGGGCGEDFAEGQGAAV